MTIFGVMWIIIIIFCFPSIKRMIAITIVSSVFQSSNIFVFGNMGVGPQIITSIVFIFRMLLTNRIYIRTNRYKLNPLYLLFFALFVIVIYTSIRNHVFSSVILRIIQLGVYMTCLPMMKRAGRYLTKEDIYYLIRKITYFHIIVGFIQFAVTAGIIPRLGLMKLFFYNDNTSTAIMFTRTHYYRVFSTYMEPSYYAGYIVGAFYYFLAYKEKRKDNKLLICLCGIQIIMTFSSSAYGAFLIMGIIFLVSLKEMKTKYKSIAIGILGFSLIYLLFYDVLDSVIFSKMNSGSWVHRSSVNRLALLHFRESPIFGVGYLQSRASSVIYTLLAETGVLGLIIYICINSIVLSKVFKDFFHKSKKQTQVYAISLALLSCVITQIIGVPVIDICTYWMWLNLFAIVIEISKREKNHIVIPPFSHHQYILLHSK